MGYDSIGPFLEYSEKLSFILALTSNKSSLDFEKLKLETGLYLYQKVISKVNEWNINDNCGLVFGATNTAELVKNIEGFGNLPVLLPGVGAQGGSLKDVVSTFRNHNNPNYIINISRGLLYVDDSKDFGRSTKKVLEEYNEQIFFLYK
jgi:orotidine-5'-phosphate decarboxylase